MTTVLAGGKFNKIHPGHLWLLRKAKSLGDRLVVVLANDAHNRRPYAVPARQRKKNIENLEIADTVVIGSPSDYFKVVEKFRPDIIVLGYDQRLPSRTRERIRKMKIKIVKLRKHGNYASRNS